MLLKTFLLVLMAVYHGDGAETDTELQYTRVIGSPFNGSEVPMDVMLSRHSMMTYPGTPKPPQECFQTTINLHDFDKKLVAMKSVEKDVCLIKHSNKTFEEIQSLVNDIKKGAKSPLIDMTEELLLKKKEIKPEDLEKTTGKKLAKFCSDYKVYWLEEGNAVLKLRRKRFLNINIKIGCMFCWGRRRKEGGENRVDRTHQNRLKGGGTNENRLSVVTVQ